MTDILRQKLSRSPDAFASSVGKETVLLQVKRGTYYGLDEMGTRFWAALNDCRDFADVCAEIASEHDVSLETVEADARAFLEDLRANDIIVAE